MKQKYLALLTLLALLFSLAPAALAVGDAPPAAPMVVAAGDSSFYVDSQGRLWAWGCNEYGQLGDGTRNDTRVPVKVMEGVASVASSGLHTLAVKADGSLWGWGLCANGRLGDTAGNGFAAYKGMTLPIQTVPVCIQVGRKIVAVAAGAGGSLCLNDRGHLWSIGGVKEEADGTWSDYQAEPVKLLEGVERFAAGYDSASAVLETGEYYTWSIIYTQDPYSHERYHTPIYKENLKIAQRVHGANHAVNIHGDGTVSDYGWALHDAAQSGQRGLFPVGATRTSTKIPLAGKAVAVTAGYGFGGAVLEDGSLWMWGCNEKGQLGSGDAEDSAVPVKVLDNVVQVSSGDSHTLALLADGTVWGWGDGGEGQLTSGRLSQPGPLFPAPMQLRVTPPEGSAKMSVETRALNVDGVDREYWKYSAGTAAEGGQSFNSLRTVAAILSGTPAQFDVSWDGATQSVHITTGVPYQAIGDELTVPADGTYLGAPATAPLYVDGQEVFLPGYVVEGRHAYSFWSLGSALGIDTERDNAGNLYLNTAPAEGVELSVYPGLPVAVDGRKYEIWNYGVPAQGDAPAQYYTTLRQAAVLLSGTPARFGMTWDEAGRTMHITTGAPYQARGDELTAPKEGPHLGESAGYALFVDGREVFLPGMVVDGQYCCALRALCAALGVDVTGSGEDYRLNTAPVLYAAALADAETVEPEELLPLKTSLTQGNEYAVWNEAGDKVLVCTWNDTPQAYPDGETVTVAGDPVWVFSGAELADWYTDNAAGVTDWELRLCQLLGLPWDAGYTHVSALWVPVDRLARPAYDPDVTKNTMTAELTGIERHRQWFRENTAASYGPGGYPWTRLGYTYDWAAGGTEYGLTEFIIRPNTQVTVDKTLATVDYLDALAG